MGLVPPSGKGVESVIGCGLPPGTRTQHPLGERPPATEKGATMSLSNQHSQQRRERYTRLVKGMWAGHQQCPLHLPNINQIPGQQSFLPWASQLPGDLSILTSHPSPPRSPHAHHIGPCPCSHLRVSALTLPSARSALCAHVIFPLEPSLAVPLCTHPHT